MSRYWKLRARKYNRLKWVQDIKFINELISFANIRDGQHVLDAGCGTGVVSEKIVEKKDCIIYAVDKSSAMLDKARNNNNIGYFCQDIEDTLFSYTNYFDRIIFRMTLHHIDNYRDIFPACYKSLDSLGELVIEEGGVLPTGKVFDWYREMMAKKEERYCFTEPQLESLFTNSGFKNVKIKKLVRRFSINDWLDNSGQDKNLRKEIYDTHLNAPKYVKKFYNMKNRNGEITIDSPTLLIKGRKK